MNASSFAIWYYYAGKDRLGPFEERDFLREIIAGRVQASTFVWHQGATVWMKFSESPLAVKFGNASGPPPDTQSSEPPVDIQSSEPPLDIQSSEPPPDTEPSEPPPDFLSIPDRATTVTRTGTISKIPSFDRSLQVVAGVGSLIGLAAIFWLVVPAPPSVLSNISGVWSDGNSPDLIIDFVGRRKTLSSVNGTVQCTPIIEDMTGGFAVADCINQTGKRIRWTFNQEWDNQQTSFTLRITVNSYVHRYVHVKPLS